jgi:hypothetical protein
LRLKEASASKVNRKSHLYYQAKALKDIKGVLFLFNSKDNQISFKEFSKIFYHLGTIQNSYEQRVKAGLQPSLRMKLEIKFEEELWY